MQTDGFVRLLSHLAMVQSQWDAFALDSREDLMKNGHGYQELSCRMCVETACFSMPDW